MIPYEVEEPPREPDLDCLERKRFLQQFGEWVEEW